MLVILTPAVRIAVTARADPEGGLPAEDRQRLVPGAGGQAHELAAGGGHVRVIGALDDPKVAHVDGAVAGYRYAQGELESVAGQCGPCPVRVQSDEGARAGEAVGSCRVIESRLVDLEGEEAPEWSKAMSPTMVSPVATVRSDPPGWIL